MFKRVLMVLAIVGWLAAPLRYRLAQAEPVHAAGAAAAHGEGEHETPNLIPNLADRQVQLHAMWVLIIFIILLVILYPTAWKNVLAGLKAREQKIRGDIAAAEDARLKAEATLGEYNKQLATAEAKMREIIAQGVKQADAIATDIKAKAQKESEATKARALADIETAKKDAITEIYTHAAELSTSIASKILKRNLNAADQQDLVRSGLDQLQKVG